MRRLLVLFCAVLWIMFFLFVSGEKLQDIERNPLTVEAPGVFPSDSPPCFIPNMGQVPQRVKFHTRTPTYTLWLTNEGLVFRSAKKAIGLTPPGEIRLVFPGADKSPVLLPAHIDQGKVHLEESPLSRKKMGNSMSRAVLYKNIYKSIDLIVYGMDKQVGCNWVVNPGGNPRDIRLEYRYVKSTRFDQAGDLQIETVLGTLTHKRPRGYQEIGGPSVKGKPAEPFYVKVKLKKISENVYALETGAFRKDHVLIISTL
jgi:hypothetical protein